MAAKKRSQRRKPKGLIQCYGVHWRKTAVRWESKRGGLWGNRRRKNYGRQPRHVNFWGQAGVYVLYNSMFEAIYSGQTTSLGGRLRNHTRHAWLGPKWEYFSWFGVRKINKRGDDLLKQKANYVASARVVLDTLEAVLIAVGARTENKQGPKLHGAHPYFQVSHDTLLSTEKG
ncbi:MAG: GIY-YIG nuclease family protein [Dehalococcoidia bacterium]